MKKTGWILGLISALAMSIGCAGPLAPTSANAPDENVLKTSDQGSYEVQQRRPRIRRPGRYWYGRRGWHPTWWGSRTWYGRGIRPAWWGGRYVLNRYILIGGYYYPYYLYDGYYYPDYTTPYYYQSGYYYPHYGSQPIGYGQQGPIMPENARIIPIRPGQMAQEDDSEGNEPG